jgi:hypothetical protein
MRLHGTPRQTTSPKARVQGARVSRKQGVLPVRRSDRGTKRNAEIGLSANPPAGRRLRPKPEFKARESRASKAYSLYAAATAGRSATRKSGFRQILEPADDFAQSPSSRRASLAQARRTPCTPQRPRDEAQRGNRAFGEVVTSALLWGRHTPSSRRTRSHPPDCRPWCL